MAQEEAREAEALDWAEATVGDVALENALFLTSTARAEKVRLEEKERGTAAPSVYGYQRFGGRYYYYLPMPPPPGFTAPPPPPPPPVKE